MAVSSKTSSPELMKVPRRSRIAFAAAGLGSTATTWKPASKYRSLLCPKLAPMSMTIPSVLLFVDIRLLLLSGSAQLLGSAPVMT